MEIRTGHFVPHREQNLRDPTHARSPDTDKMDLLCLTKWRHMRFALPANRALFRPASRSNCINLRPLFWMG
jgi:hypothetical protein